MSAELAVMYGFIGSAAILIYMGFRFQESEQMLIQMLGLIMINIVLLMVFGALVSVKNMADSNSLLYLNDTVGAFIIPVLVIIILVMFMMMWKMAYSFYDYFMKQLKPWIEKTLRFGGDRDGKN